ncbi:MAG: GTP-binding protein [Chloroflexi bacterium]|nr:GTP-binding protein [Chloroflexota bacterium]
MKVLQKKVCLLGDFAVGKTSLVRQFVEGRFDDRYLSTIGVKVSRKTLLRPDFQLNLLIWDLVGGNELSYSEASYMVAAAGALIVCDLTRANTLDALTRYANQVRTINPNVSLVFLGNKVDLIEQRAITEEQLTAVTSDLRASYFLTSAKTGENVEAAFTQLARLVEAG